MPRRQHKFHFIYKVTCLLNQKFYIGMHSTSNMNDGYMGSGLRIKRSLNKHGIANHKIEYLEFFNNRSELKQREAELVNESILQDPLCMNIKLGGEGGWDKIYSSTENSKYALSIGRARLKWLREHDENFCKRLSENISKALKTKIKNGWKLPPNFLGKQHSPETKKLMSTSHIGKHVGNKNSQFNTCWIYKDNETKKIKIDQLDEFIKNNWCRGRKRRD